MDLGAGKHISLTERVHLEFRTELFNIFNHPEYEQQQSDSSDVAQSDIKFAQGTGSCYRLDSAGNPNCGKLATNLGTRHYREGPGASAHHKLESARHKPTVQFDGPLSVHRKGS